MNKKKLTISSMIATSLACGAIVGVFGIGGYFGGGADKGVPDDTWTRGLVASYDFDEGSGQVAYNAAATGQVNDGTLGSSASADSADPKWIGGQASSQLGGGLASTALSFDGKDDYVNCGNDSSLNITDAITIEAWVYLDSLTNFSTIVGRKAWSDSYWFVVVPGASYGLGVRLEDAQNTTQYEASIFPTKEWVYVAFTYDSSTGNGHIYRNGVVTKNWSGSGAVGTPSESLRIGVSSEYSFNGSIDGVKIYNRALSADEVRYHYNRGGPVAHWKFDEGSGESAEDSSGNNNDGTLKSSALDFDGSDDYVDCGNDSSLDMGTDDWTVEAWVKLVTDQNSTFGYKGAGSNTSEGWWFFYYEPSQDLRFYISNGTSRLAGHSNDSLSVADGDWHHIAASADRSSDVTFYLDGSAVGTTSISSFDGQDISNSAIDLQLGSYSYFFDGSIDEVRIYNAALTTEEVARHYEGDFSQDPTGNLVMLHHFEEGTYCDTDGVANCLTNDTPNATYKEVNHGTLYNFDDLPNYDAGVDGWVTTNKKPLLRWAGGRFASAGKFDGGGDRVYQAYDSAFDFGTSSFTISSWFKHNTIAISSDYLLSRYDDDQGYKVWMDSAGDMCFGIDDDNSWGPDDSACTDGIDYDDNQWHHLTAYKDGTSAIYLYIDSVLVASKVSLVATGTLTSNSATLNIGSDVGVGSEAPNDSYYINTWEGEIDDMKIYAYGRSADEIRLDYNAGYAAKFGGRPVLPQTGGERVSCAADPASCMDLGLVGHWNMDEAGGDTLYDQSDNGNDGTLGSSVGADSADPKWIGGQASSQLGGGLASTALSFDGKDDYVNCGNDPSLDITDAITIEAWVKFDTNPSSDRCILGKRAAYDSILQYNNTAMKSYIYFDTDGLRFATAPNAAVAGNWYHYASVYDGTQMILYMNGVAGTPIDITDGDTIVSNNNSVIVGKHSNQANREFNGSIDGVKIYNRALSAEEVRYHYNCGGPVAHWKFDEGSGQYARDSIGTADAQLGVNASSSGDSNDPSWSR